MFDTAFPVFKRQRQENHQNFNAIQVYRVLSWPSYDKKTVILYYIINGTLMKKGIEKTKINENVVNEKIGLY